MSLDKQMPYLDYDHQLEVPPCITIIDNCGEELNLSLNIWIDYDNQWHAGYRNWTADASLHESSCLINAGLRSACLWEVLDALKTNLKTGLFYDTSADGERGIKGGEG